MTVLLIVAAVLGGLLVLALFVTATGRALRDADRADNPLID